TSIDFKSFLENVIYNKKFLKEDKQLNKDIEIYSNYTIDFIKDNIDFIENNIDIIYYDYKELKELLDNFIPQQSFLKRILTIIQLYYSSKKDKILLILEENEKSILEQLNNLKLLEDSSRNLSLKKNN
ncbi:MAG: hypothetical protein M0Q02_12580, partial [Candidatus Muirbacterium halophilum]|nr:hypothetical protein [Candidatus Muirbacterium halophilum]